MREEEQSYEVKKEHRCVVDFSFQTTASSCWPKSRLSRYGTERISKDKIEGINVVSIVNVFVHLSVKEENEPDYVEEI